MTLMSRPEALLELQKLSEMPAAAYVGTRVDGTTMTRACTRCGKMAMRSIKGLTPLMEREFVAWLVEFSNAHAACVAATENAP